MGIGIGIGIGIGMRKEEGVRGFEGRKKEKEKKGKEKGKRNERKKEKKNPPIIRNMKFHLFMNTYSLTRALHKTYLACIDSIARKTCSCYNR